MTAKEALTKLTVMLGLNTPEVLEASTEVNVEEPTAEQAFSEAVLADGTTVMTEGELAVGATLYVVTEEENVLAPEGMHETSEGQIITVGADGVITAIEDKVQETPVVEAPVAAEADFSEDLVKSIADVIAPALAEIQSLKEEVASLHENFSSFKNEPAAKKITNNLSEYKQAEASFTDARFDALKKIAGKK